MWTKELELAKKAAKTAGEFLKKREGIHVDALEGKDIKLSSDKMSEKIIIKGLDELACVSVALWAKDKPVLGAVYRFMKDELFYGAEGEGAFLNGESIKPSSVQETSQAVMATGFPVKRSYDTESLSKFVKQVQCFKKVRMLGAAAIMGTFVSCGRLDAYFEDEIMLWDIAAAVAIVNAAGGATSLELLDNNKCLCKCFATRGLMEDYYAKSL